MPGNTLSRRNAHLGDITYAIEGWQTVNRYRCALVVDDDPFAIEVTSTILRALGVCKVIPAKTGVQALTQIATNGSEIDLIIIDLQMPEMDGLTLLRRLKERRYEGNIVILSMMGSTLISLAKRISEEHQLNILGILNKPLDRRALAQLLSNAWRPSVRAAAGTQTVGEESEVSLQMLLQGLDRREIIPYLQPKLSVSTRRVVGAEALARWRHKDLGLIVPRQFIPLAARHGLIGDLTWTFLPAAFEAARLCLRHVPEFKLSVNVHPGLFEDLNLPDRLATVMDQAGIPPEAVILEVTESGTLAQTSKSMEVAGRLHLMGVELSIDDFGTGLSNLDSLRVFPFSELKLDRSFVLDATVDERSRTSIVIALQLSRELGLRVVAEGVETVEQFEFIDQMGVDQVQGYLFSQPLPVDQFMVWMKTYDLQRV